MSIKSKSLQFKKKKKKKFRGAKVRIEPGAMNLQSITYTTEELLTIDGLI